MARLGEHALEGASTLDVMQEAIAAGAELLGVEIATVLELSQDGEALEFRATHGLSGNLVGEHLPAGDRSQAGYSIQTSGAVIVEDWHHEQRFRRAEILTAHSVRSGLTVMIEGRTGPFGVLGVHSFQPRTFSTGDIDFVSPWPMSSPTPSIAS